MALRLARSQVRSGRRPAGFRPHILTLEGRLPLGDTLLGPLTSLWLVGSTPAGLAHETRTTETNPQLSAPLTSRRAALDELALVGHERFGDAFVHVSAAREAAGPGRVSVGNKAYSVLPAPHVVPGTLHAPLPALTPPGSPTYHSTPSLQHSAVSSQQSAVSTRGTDLAELVQQGAAAALHLRSDRPIVVTGDVHTGGRLVIEAPEITVRGMLRGSTVALVSAGTVHVEAGSAVLATGGGLAVTADVFVNVGQVRADGAHGGQLTVSARNVLNAGRISADGTTGDGGRVWVGFAGAYIDTAAAVTSASSAAGRGGQVTLTGGRLFSSGTQRAAGAGQGGAVELLATEVARVAATEVADARRAGFRLIDPHPGHAGGLGFALTELRNGNLVATKPGDDFGGAGAGAAYLFSGRTGALLGAMLGQAGDQVGFVSPTPAEDGGAGPDGFGAQVGSRGAVPLANGHYVVRSPQWNSDRGAATWGDGTVGTSGIVSATNSLVGSNPGDRVSGESNFGGGGGDVTPLANGNYVVVSPDWNGRRGAVTWGDGAAGTAGIVAASNSLVGTYPDDRVGGSFGVTTLANGNYVVGSQWWNDYRGAATWADGTTGVTGPVSAANSLVGVHRFDSIGNGGITALSNGNYVVSSSSWNGERGASTWADGTTGITGVVSAGNSLVGSTWRPDGVGASAIALPNGNYVVSSSSWNKRRGAVTWANGTAGIVGEVGAGNSLVGSRSGDRVGDGLSSGSSVSVLPNGNYLVHSSWWNGSRGAVTWADGTTGLTGEVDAGNSLVGASPSDGVGFTAPVLLSNGNYVIRSGYQSPARGAVTWGDGAKGVRGVVSAENSLVGTASGDVGRGGVIALTNGHYVVCSPHWNYNTGAVTWVDGRVGLTGTVEKANSLVGANYGDFVGSAGGSFAPGAVALANGNYVVRSPYWNEARGAATWADGATGLVGIVSADNSLIGTEPGDQVSRSTITALANGNYVVGSPLWNDSRGAATWGDGTTGTTGTVWYNNSLGGINVYDAVGESITALTNGNYVVRSLQAERQGSATWADGTRPATGIVDANNSLVGSSAGDRVGDAGIVALPNGNYVVRSPDWNGRRGAATWVDGSLGLTGAIDAGNSLVGSNPGDQVSSGVGGSPGTGLTILRTGNYVVNSPNWDRYRGASTWGDGTLGVVGPVDETNSLVG